MNPDLDTLATRLYVTIDDLLIDHPQWAPERPAVGITPKLTDAELLTLASQVTTDRDLSIADRLSVAADQATNQHARLKIQSLLALY